MKDTLTDFQLEVEKGINDVLKHLGKHVVDRRVAGIEETFGMKATHALIQSERFPCVWSEQPDRDPPPGREFAQALLAGFADRGASPRKPKVEDRDWEHSSWFFWVSWQGGEFQVDLEPSPHDTSPPTWRFGIARVRGVIRALFGSRQSRFDVPGEFLSVAGEVLQQTAGCQAVTWITEDQAVAALWGCPAEG